MLEKISLKPIGFVSSPVTERTDENWGQVVSRIVLKHEYAGGLLGLDDFSHAIVMAYLHEAKYDPPKHIRRRPRGTGVYA